MLCVSVFGLSYPACKAHAPYYIVIRGLPRCTVFSYIISNCMIFGKRVIERETCGLILYTVFVWDISHYKKNWESCDKKLYIYLRVKCPSFLLDFNETWIFWTCFSKNTQISNFIILVYIFNLLKPTGHVMHQQLNIQQLYALPTLIYVFGIYLRTDSWGTRWRSWLRHCATNRKVACSIPDGVSGIFHWHNPWRSL